MQRIRNFSIIAHIDHGNPRSLTASSSYGGLPDRERYGRQVLDSMELGGSGESRSKRRPGKLNYKAGNGETYS